MNPDDNMILLVDDDQFVLDMLHEQLAGIGWHQVICATSGTRALEQFVANRQKIVLCVCDLSMPDMDGLVLLRHLAQQGYRAAICLLSGVSDEILHSAAGLVSAHGLDLLGVLTKPASTRSLQDMLHKLQPAAAARIGTSLPELARHRLLEALSADEFIPWYQPKVDLRNGAVAGVEALARWPTAAGGMIGPGSFVPALESAGLAEELFFSMARQVITDLDAWRRQGIFVQASINLSMDDALDLDMPERLLHLLDATGVQPGDLIIEVTESKLMVQRSVAMETLTRLSLMGFILSIDDFGTGYSSLAQLVDLPFRELKIDGSFVQRALAERKAEAVARISITIGVNLGMRVVAEGVETEAQMDFLRSCGGTIVQGYHLARPMPAAACTDWLRRQDPRMKLRPASADAIDLIASGARPARA
ncbi:MAG: EAL domain-containing response regulator [Rhodoferax sp.]|nr:EAL domain-containing response regulator [Rhodoferax sp.]